MFKGLATLFMVISIYAGISALGISDITASAIRGLEATVWVFMALIVFIADRWERK